MVIDSVTPVRTWEFAPEPGPSGVRAGQILDYNGGPRAWIRPGQREARQSVLDFRGKLRAAQRGDGDAFAAIWREFQPGLVRYLSIRAAPAADDLAADVWARIVCALPSFEGDERRFKSWLYTAARNRLTDWYRHNQRQGEKADPAILELLVSDDQVEQIVAERAEVDDALALVSCLPTSQAEAVTLRVVVGLDVATVAEVMDRSQGAIRVLCHRGLRQLERWLNLRDEALAADGQTRASVADAEGSTAATSMGSL